MSTLTFDTLKFANRLKTAGVPAVQAEAEADALAEVFETNLSELATNAKLEKTESALRQEMSNMKFELLKWMIGLAIAQAGLLVGLIGLLVALLNFSPINS
jgi:hypothetical protein